MLPSKSVTFAHRLFHTSIHTAENLVENGLHVGPLKGVHCVVVGTDLCPLYAMHVCTSGRRHQATSKH